MANPERMAFEKSMEQLNQQERLLYLTAFRLFGSSALQLDSLREELSGQLSGLELDLAVLRLRGLQLLKTVKKTWGEQIYYIPSAHLVWLTELTVLPKLPLSGDHDSMVEHVLLEAKSDITGEVLHILSYIAIHGMPLTAKGTIHKKTLGRLGEMTVLESSDFEGLALSYAHPDVYPVHIAVIMDLLFSLGLVRKEEGQITIDEDVLNSWLDLSNEQMRQNIYHIAVERYGPSIPGAQHFRSLLTCCGRRDAGLSWLSLDMLCTCLVDNGFASQMSTNELAVAATGWARLLAAFGYGELGSSTDGTYYFRFEEPVDDDADRAEDRDEVRSEDRYSGIFVQPDFEVMVPQSASKRLTWILEGCAELKARDRMTIYKLTKERLHLAAEHGLEPDTVMEWLEQYSETGVPDQVRLTLEQWGDELGKTTLEAVILLRCANLKDADAIEAHPSYSMWRSDVERIGPNYFIVNKDKLSEIQKNLTAMGLSPAKGIKGLSADAPVYPLTKEQAELAMRFSTETGRQGFVYTGNNLHYYEKVEDTPHISNLMPDFKSIPKSWYEEWREYHPSTAKQMVQQAISWRIRLGIECAGIRREFIPESIGRGEPWSVNGYFAPDRVINVVEKSTLVPSEWTKMSLILPK